MINARVRRVRKAKGVTTNFMAEQLGLTRQQYNNIERGIAGIESERLEIIAGLLHEEPGIFFKDSLTNAVIERVKGGIIRGNYRRADISTAARPGGGEEDSPGSFEDRAADSK